MEKCKKLTRIFISVLCYKGSDFSCGSMGKDYVCITRDIGDVRSIPGSGRSPGEENATLSNISCLKNPLERGAYWATV